MSGADWSNDARSTMLLGSPRDVGHGQQPPARSEMLPQTKSAIERFADRRARLQLCRGVMLGVAALVVGLLVVVLLDYGFRMGTMVRCALAILVDVVAVTVAWFGGVRASRRRDWREVALSMEAVTPALRERLLSAVELEDPRVANGSVEFRGKLQTGVASDLSKVEIRRMLPWSLIRRSLFFATGLFGLVVGVSAIPSLQMPRRMARAFVPFVPIERASFTKIEIVEPSPASAIVAEGDLVSVAAALQHLGDRVVELQWRDENGRRGNQIMGARDYAVVTVPSDEKSDEIQQHGERERRSFAANIQVDNVTVHYRVVAADAETLWHTLTPMPRPRALEFEKRYKFPSYAKLPDQVVVDQHGDLEAIVGTRAEVSVRFDQPVRAAEVSFGDADSDVKIPMNPVDGDATRFQYRVAVTTPGGYRINAVSSQSGFDNPFLPRWAIDPVTDQNPVAAWASDVDRRQICSPAAVLRLRGRVEDDLPMDRVIFQYARDDDSVRERSLPINPAEDNHAFAFDWDMEDLAATGTAREILPAGTRLKARLIALDRAGRRGASEWLHVFIDGADFDAKRHDDMYEMYAFTRGVNQWWGDLDRWIRQSVEILQREAVGSENEIEVTATPSQVMPMKELNALAERWRRIAGAASANGEVRDVDGELSLREMVARTNDPVAADRWVMLDRAVSTQISRLLDVANDREAVSVDRVRESLSQTQSFAGEIRDLVSQTLAIELAIAAYSDFRSIRTATFRLGDENANIPIERLSGQAELLVEHLRQNDAMIAELQDELPNDTVRHLQNFRQFLDETAVRIEEAGETLRLDRNPDVESNFRDAIRRHGEAMSGRHFGFLVHSSTFDRIAGAVRELASPRWQPNSEFVRLSERADERDEQFALAGDRLLRAYDEATEWEKVRRDSIVEVAADERLVQRVVEYLTQEEFLGQGPSDNGELFARIREATGMLYSGGRAIRLMRQLQDMIDRERHGTDDTDLRVQQTIRLSHYQMAGEAPLQYLLDRHRGDDRFEKLRATRWADDYAIARQRMTRRLHHVDAIVSAATPVQRMVDVYGDAMPVIETSMHEAREMLRSLLPSVVELARKAAAEARRDNAEDRLDQLQDDVQRVAESLVDRADRADLTEDAERELAVDADAALREIQRRMESVSLAEEERDSENPNDVSESLDALADTLERTADHFAASDAGEDVTQTREALRESAGDDSGRDLEAETTPEAIDDARDEAESAEQLARSDPQELLRRLEERLQRDPPMQASLGEIGERTVTDVENAVRAVAEQEADLQRQLERSDSEFVERKRAVRERVESIVSQARSVERQWLATAEKASFRARDQRLLDRVRGAREGLQDAIERAEQTQKRELLMSEFGDVVERLRSAIERAASESRETNAAAEEASDEALYSTEREREQIAKESESMERRMLNEWVKSLDQNARQWRQRQEQATRRMQQNRNEQRSAENQLRKAEKQLAANPDQQWARDNVETSQDRVDQAKRAVDVADRTRQEAVAGQQEAKQLANEARKHSIGDFDSANPAAELVGRAAERSHIELERLAETLQEVSADLGDQPVPVPPLPEIRSIAKEQQQARDAVRQAADDLERAARHEDRLGENAGAESLREVAQRLNQVADSTMQEALESMRDAEADHSESSTGRPSRANVGDQLAVAAKRLAEQAEMIAGVSRQSEAGDEARQEPNGAPENQGTLDQADQSEKLARTLDELDRQLNQRGSSATEEAGESNGDSSGDSRQPMEQAGQASSTLQRTASQAARKLAEQRQQSLSQIASAGQQRDSNGDRKPSNQDGQRVDSENADRSGRGEPSSRSGERDSTRDDSSRGQDSGDRSGNDSGDSIELPGGGLLSLDAESRSGDQWGNLRERKSDNVIQDRKTPIPLSYRSAVEAYFRAIAAEAARGGRARQASEVPDEQ